MDLPSNILTALKKMGFDEMTPIQEATYPIIVAGQDLCALAETGTGKTAACAIPLIQKVDTTQNTIQGLVVVPTRELCLQYVTDIQRIVEKTDLAPFAIYGGFSREIQIAKLKHGVHILVATPGRLMDLLYDGIVNLSNVKCVILDEADELLQKGFFSEIKLLLSCIIHEHQTMLFSATMADDIKKLAHDCLRDPKHISLIKNRAAPASIEHHFCYLHPKNKRAELVRFIKEDKISQAIIFCNARHLVDKLFRTLRDSVKNVDYIHAGLRQEKRTSIITKFRRKQIHYLIATDVAGRGLDFSHVSHIINWDFPGGKEQYTHRTGRAGRMGRKGKAVTFVAKHDLPAFKELVKNKKITPIWVGKDPFQKQDPISSTNHHDPKNKKR
ncbi:MAG: DEAD/DEAH box helicase [Candidatus Theseobacter exili]|nr:DEAD/DEAH box helicase [Candidatus Theseobacter exili]